MTKRDEDLASTMIAARLQDPAYRDKLAVARSRGRDLLGDDQVSRDLLEMNDIQLRAKYGADVQRQSAQIGKSNDDLRDSDNSDRSFGETVSDGAVSAANALYRDLGNLGTLAYGYAEGALDGDPETTGQSRAAELTNAHTKMTEGMMQENLTEEIQERQRFSAIEGEMQSQIEEAQYEAEVADGDNEFLAKARREGRNALNALGRMADDPALAGNIIAEGIGSLYASAPFAGAGGLVAKGATNAVVKNTIAQRVAKAAGFSAGAGVQEVSGVYAETVQDVMSIPDKELSEMSSVYNALIEEGHTPEEAKVQLAGIAAETAAIGAIIPSFALGFITSKFEAMPLGAFIDTGITRGLLQIAGEGLEEAGQGVSGTVIRNLSVENYAEIGRDSMEGVGEEAALGALGGIGVAGVAAGPATVRGATRSTAQGAVDAANALFGETQYNDPLRQDMMGGSRAANATSPVRSAASSLVRDTAQKATGAVSDTVNSINSRDDRAQTSETVTEAVKAAQVVEDEMSRENLSPEVSEKIASADVKPSKGFQDVVASGQNLMQNTVGMFTKLADKKFKPSNEDKAFIAEQVKTLRNAVGSLPEEAQLRLGRMLQDPAVKKAVKDAQEFDLNETPPAPDQAVETTVNVAKTNPANVNPEQTKKILEESGDTISEEDKKYLGVASKVASIINTAKETLTTIRQEQNIRLEALGEEKDRNLTPDYVGRQIMAKGYTKTNGDRLRSLNDFASDIIQGVQSPDGTFINQNGEVVNVRTVAQSFGKFLEHMNNRVEALNRSFDNNKPNSKGRMTGTGEKYRHLRNGEFWVDVDDPTWSGGLLMYHQGNPGSIAFAERVASETERAYEIYAAMNEAFPEVFSDITPPSLVQLKKVEDVSQQTEPTVVEEVSAETDEQGIEAGKESREQNNPFPNSVLQKPVFHASNDENFSIQNIETVRENNGNQIWLKGDIGNRNDKKVGFYVTRDPVYGAAMAGATMDLGTTDINTVPESDMNGVVVHSLYVNITNPYVPFDGDPITPTSISPDQLQDLKDQGYDGIIDGTDLDSVQDIIVFEKDQIAEANQPTAVEESFDAQAAEATSSENNTETEDSPSAVEEESESEGGESESGTTVTDEVSTTEESVSDETPTLQEMMEAETRTKDDFSAMTEDELIESANKWFVDEKGMGLEKMPENRQATLRELIDPIISHFNLPANLVTGITWLRTPDKKHLGQAMWGERLIGMRAGAVKALLGPVDRVAYRDAEHTLYHELMHLVDAYASSDVTRPRSHQSDLYSMDPQADGRIYKEVKAAIKDSPYSDRLGYLSSFDNTETMDHMASEAFAEIGAFYLENPDLARETFPEGVKDVEKAIQEAGGTILPEVSNEGDTASDTVSETEAANEESVAEVTHPSFEAAYQRDERSLAPESLDALEQQVANDGGLNTEILARVREAAPVVLQAMNSRLKKIKTSIDGKSATVFEHIKDGKIQEIRQYRATSLVNPNTGEYNQNLIELATVAMIDWMSTASAQDPSRIVDNLERQGLSMVDISDAQLMNMAFGLAPNQLKPQLANAIVKMWGMKNDNSAKMAEVYGIAEGVASEMLVAMESEFDFFEIKEIELTSQSEITDDVSGEKKLISNKTDTVLLNMENIRGFQESIRSNSKVGVKDTARDYLFNEEREQYSYGEKIKSVSRTQDRSNIRLSRREQTALKTMQDTPHFKDEDRANIFFSQIGVDALKRVFGFVENVNEETYPNGSLRRSIMGKNLSIENDIADAEVLTDTMYDDTIPVYYPVGITRVGRHQYKGVNPQSNKVLRALVTPTWVTVDIASQENAVWLGVAQAADLFKIEKRNHEEVLSKVQDEFNLEYGRAKDMILEHLRDGTDIDPDAFVGALLGNRRTSIEPQILAAIHTVAKMQLAKERGEKTFESSLSVELDGLTNGAANMMVNYGQGEMTTDEYLNLRRIGYFVGKVGMTVNVFFEDPKNVDLYETTSRKAQQKLNKMLMSADVGREAQAARRFATWFGDFDTSTGNMTRNSAKNPMTKVNYGSGVLGVGTGLADDMMIEFYQKLHDANYDISKVMYDGDLLEDLKTLGVYMPENFSNSWEFSKGDRNSFRSNITNTIGKALTEAAQETLGSKIKELNDMLVFSTNVQAEYLNNLFMKRISDRAEEMANNREIRRNPKTNNPIISDMPVEEYNKIVDELAAMSPIFTSDDQTLAIGSFKPRIANNWPVLSSSLDNKLNQKPNLRQPDSVGVKALPFMVIGTGDAMMMNLIFSDPNAPKDALGIFDGLDIPVTKLAEYGPMVNKAVLQSWERDVLSMAVENFRGFLNNTAQDEVALAAAFRTVRNNSKKSTVTAENAQSLMIQLDQRLAANRARKAVFKRVGSSVDQMGGSGVGFTREGGEVGLTALNQMIAREVENRPVETPQDLTPKLEEVKTPTEETTLDAVLKATRFTAAQKKIVDIIRPGLSETRVVKGTLDQLNSWRLENLPEDGEVLKAPAQYDPINNIIFISTNKNETMLHELVHAATFNKVLQHYEGETNAAVTQLETLVEEFLAINDGGEKVREAQKAILIHQSKNDSFSKAAVVNELMAYVLANNKVRTKAQNTEASLIKKLSDKVIRLMRRLLGNPPVSIYDAVAFNTKVIVDGPIDDEPDTGGNGDGGGNNPNGELTPPANNYNNYWIQQLADYINSSPLNFKGLNERRAEQVAVRKSVDKIVDSFRQVGMLSNDEALATFKAIYGVVNSSITLKSQPLIAMTNVFEHIVENMTPEMFGDGPEANQEYSAVLNAFGEVGNQDMINSISVLLGLSQTSAKFRKVLDQIPEPETGNTSTGLQDSLTIMSSALMNNITATLSEAGNQKDVMDMLAATIVEHDKDREFMLLKKVTNSLTKADAYVSGKMSQMAEGMRKVDSDMKESTRSETRKHLVSLLTLGTNYLDKPGTDLTNNYVKNVFHMGLPIISMVPIRELVSEMVGTDANNRNVVALQDRVNAAISGMRQAYREDLPGILARLFDEKPTSEQWTSMYNVLAKTDFSALVDTMNVDQSLQLLRDKVARTDRINALEAQVNAKTSGSNTTDAKAKAEQLARHMTKQGTGKLLAKNAYAIAKNLDGEFDASLVPVLDELISIYALDMMNPDQRDSVADLYDTNPQALEQIVVYMKGLNDAEEAKPNITEVARLNAMKGFIPNEGSENTRVVVAPKADKNTMKLKGYTRLGDYTGDVNNKFERSYYVTNIRNSGQYAQGTMQNVSSTYRGVDTNTGLSVGGDFTGYVAGEGTVDNAVTFLNQNSYQLENEFETWVPVLGSDGAVQGFERSIDPNVLEAHLGREENLAIMLGAWAGRQVEETNAYQYNIQLVDELDRIWQNREPGEEKLFVNMKETDDKIYQESFKLIPQDVKAYMDEKFDGRGMMVRSDMANLSVGYREFSMADMWSGKTRMPEQVQKVVQGTTQLVMGRNAMKWLVQAETGLQSSVSTAKDWIVVRSLVVPALNLQANVAQLVSRGVPLKTMQKDFRRKLAEIEKHQKNMTKIIELEQMINLNANNANQKRILRDKIKALQDLNARMSIAPMIEAGAYKNLSEGITDFDRDMASGKIGEFLENMVAKIPNDKVRTIGEYGLVSKSTKIYQVANKATQYGDFLAKSVYYDHLITQGLSPDAAVEQINQEFVNFTTQPGRVRSGLERNGLSWFMAFKLRITKIAMQQLRDNPVRAIAVNYALDVGSPVEDNILTVMAEGRLDYATGLEMMFNAHELNPWYNLMTE